ncbi:acyl-[ACP]--phospholipid O-acyltransferase [Thiocystis violacea]|uniref:acyl-[ACP]--phospholipid O-acyltransferase n=1 Tax=Thiocystis violacea TaxID=13725 RepID=UPI0019050B3C|nr:acyl-[ACP]--phospholipid O-acyltransferase [Thiocystis violacea]MBK1718859.1 acyl-[ACP]--phospholipid O-acyltransferase [Thiocystis violacea]
MGQLFRITGFLPYILMIFLNAFVDLGHKIVIQNTLFKTYDGDIQILLTAIVNALILLPFVLLFTPSGFMADRFPKNRVMRASAWVAVGLTLCITLFYYLGWFWPAFAMTFLLAAQSAFYSPAKYGYIKELVGKEALASANGWVQATTTTAILAGIFFFSVLFEGRLANVALGSPGEIMHLIAPLGWVLVLCSLLEVFVAYRLPGINEGNALRFDWGRYRTGRYLRHNLGAAWDNQVIWLSIVGLSVFWAISQVILAAFPAFAKETLGETNTVVIQGMLACSGLGIILGSIVAGRVSRQHIETGLIPIGAIGIAVALFLLPGLESAWAHAANFLLLGFLAGLFLVPLNALIQFNAGESGLGRVLAANNFVQNLVMLAFLGLTVVAAFLEVGGLFLMLALAVIALAGAIYTLYQLPQSLLRFLIARVMSARYRLSVIGLENMPAQGGVLMLGNHVSWIDWAMIQMASPRPVRFVMERWIYERWYLRWFLDFFGVVPISRGRSRQAIQIVTGLLDAGEVVCLFPEGTLSKNGQLSEFKRGFELSARAAGAGVILPFYQRGLWGSRFSNASEKLRLNRRDGRAREVIVAFGPTLPLEASAERVKQAVFELSVTSWRNYVETLPTLPSAWLATAKRDPGAVAITDSIGTSLSNRRLITAVLLFAGRIRRLAPESAVGILLPASSAGAIANLAALLAGKTVVNLNYTASAEALRAGVELAGVRHVITADRFLRKLESRGIDMAAALPGVTLHPMEGIRAGIGRLGALAMLALASLLPAAWLARLFGRPSHPEDTAAILFSSGSEGAPKGIELTHRNIMANVRQISDVLNTERDDVVLSNLPLFHAFGLTATTFMPLLEGVPMVCHPDPTDAVGAAKAIARYRATVLCSTSTFLRLYTRNRKVHPLMLQSLRIVVAGAERLGPDVREAFALKFHKEILEGYGATETTPVASVNVPDALETTTWKIQSGSRPGSVGLPLPGTSFRVVDPVSLEALPPGEDGLILIGGVQVMKGYLKAPGKTAEAIVELDGTRWYKTGDKGHLDTDGFLSIVDRYSRFAKLGGEMISLGAVEEQVRRALGRADLEVAAVNLPDERKGERILLLVVEEIDADALRRKLLDAGVNPLGIPSQVVRVEAIPKLGSGKTDFGAVRRLALAS